MKPLHPEHIKNVSGLAPFERYQYFIRKVADWQVMYTLRSSDRGLVVSEVDGRFLLPFWSAVDFALPHLSGGWTNFQLDEISLDDFEEIYVPIITDKDYLLNIFPIEDKLVSL